MRKETQHFSDLLYSIPGKTDKTHGQWLPLVVHLKDTAGIMRHLAEQWIPDRTRRAICISFPEEKFEPLCIFLAMTHDIGKITPVMISKILRSDNGEILQRLSDTGLKIPDLSSFGRDVDMSPHALAGEAILLKNGIPKSLAAVIGAHHGKPQSVGEAKYQIEKYPYNYYLTYSDENKKKIWEDLWHELINSALTAAGFSSISDLPDPYIAEQMNLTGLLIMADWIASNTDYFPLISMDDDGKNINLQQRIETGWRIAHLSKPLKIEASESAEERFIKEFRFNPNEMQSGVIQTISGCNNPGLIIIEAPMGTGKTEDALIAAELIMERTGCGGIYFGLPTQATANGIYPRITAWGAKQSEETEHAVRLACGTADLNEDYRSLFHGNASVNEEDYPETGLETVEFFEGRKQALLAEIGIGTIDQVLLSSVKQNHVMLRHLGLSGKVVILDEVHAYDAYMNQYLDTTLSWLGQYKTPVIMLSATLPAGRRAELINAYTWNKNDEGNTWEGNTAYPLITWTDNGEVKQQQLKTSLKKQNVTIKRGKDECVSSYIKEALKDGGCACILVNTIKRAQYFADQLKSELKDKEIILVHSLFTDSDRAEKEKEILKRTGKSSKREERDNLIVIGTQVLEQSLDIDFDFMITDNSPMDILLQRIGRIHRHERSRPGNLAQPVCVILGADGESDPGSEWVYGKWLLRRTKELLPDTIVLPDMIPELVQKAYEEPGEETLDDPDSASDFEAYRFSLQDKKSRAKAFMLRRPEKIGKEGRRKQTINGLLDGGTNDHLKTSKEKDLSEQSAVRDGRPSVDVILMVRHKDGSVGFVPWQYGGIGFSEDYSPSEEEARKILRQRIRLPNVLCYPSVIHETIDELEELNKTYVNGLKKAPLLRNEYILCVDENLSIKLNGYLLTYDRFYGLQCSKIKEEI